MIDIASRTTSMRVLRRALTATAVAVATSVTGAGAAHAQESATLSPARFEAFDALYTALVVLEDSPTAAAIVAARSYCGGLDRSDRLLAVTRSACLSSLKLASEGDAFAACETAGECRRAVRRLRTAASQMLVDARASNRIVALELLPGPCRTELTAGPALLRSTQKLRDGLRLLERGLRTGKRAITRRGARQIAAASEELAQQPALQQSRETFRRACVPAAPPAPEAPGS